jgi:hypothetical protein
LKLKLNNQHIYTPTHANILVGIEQHKKRRGTRRTMATSLDILQEVPVLFPSVASPQRFEIDDNGRISAVESRESPPFVVVEEQLLRGAASVSYANDITIVTSALVEDPTVVSVMILETGQTVQLQLSNRIVKIQAFAGIKLLVIDETATILQVSLHRETLVPSQVKVVNAKDLLEESDREMTVSCLQ